MCSGVSSSLSGNTALVMKVSRCLSAYFFFIGYVLLDTETGFGYALDTFIECGVSRITPAVMRVLPVLDTLDILNLSYT